MELCEITPFHVSMSIRILLQVLVRQPYCWGIMQDAPPEFLWDTLSRQIFPVLWLLQPFAHSSMVFIDVWVVLLMCQFRLDPHAHLFSLFRPAGVFCNGLCCREVYLMRTERIFVWENRCLKHSFSCAVLKKWSRFSSKVRDLTSLMWLSRFLVPGTVSLLRTSGKQTQSCPFIQPQRAENSRKNIYSSEFWILYLAKMPGKCENDRNRPPSW